MAAGKIIRVLLTCVSRASEHDTKYFQYAVFKNIHGEKFSGKVYPDRGYCSETNRESLTLNGIGDGIMLSKSAFR